MKVKLEYVHPYNYGNLMMATNFISYFANSYSDKNLKFYVNVNNDDEFKRIKNSFDSSNLRNIVLRDMVNCTHSSNTNKIKKGLNFIKQNQQKIKYYDAIVYLGGDCISEYYSKKEFIKDGIRIFNESRKLPVFLVGQTIGPFTSYRKKLSHFFLKNASISTRDDICFSYLKDQIKLTNLYSSRDLAFLDLPYENEDEKIKLNLFNNYKINENEYITVVLSGLYKSYTLNKSDYVRGCFNLIKLLLEDRKIIDKKLVLLPHVIKREDSDINIIVEIEKLLSNEMKKRTIIIKKSLMPYEARIILGGGLFSITGRMHAAVSTFHMGKPSISLSYSVKYRGVIGDGLNMTELIIDAKGDEFWQKDSICGCLQEKLIYLFDNYDSIVDKIKIKSDECRCIALQQVKNIAVKLSNM